MKCELCDAVNEKHRLIMKDVYAFAIIAKEPQMSYHSLILPIRHVTKFSDLSPIESYHFLTMKEDITTRMYERIPGCSPIATLNGPNYITQGHVHFQVHPVDVGVRTVFARGLGIPEREIRKKINENPTIFEVAALLHAGIGKDILDQALKKRGW